MAPKRPAPVEEPPAVSSSSEDEVASGEVEESESEEESEEEEQPQPKPKQQLKKASSPPLSAPAVEKKPTKKPEAKPESSSSDDGSGSGSSSGSGSESKSDSDRPTRSSGVADVNVKPLAEVEEGESEEKEKQPQPKQQLKKASSPPLSAPAVGKKPTKKPEAKPESSSSDDGSESSSESESDSDRPTRSSGVADVNVKPLASKPMVVASKAKRSRSDSKAAAVVPTKSAVKRQVENNGEEKNSKRAKKKVEEVEIEEKKSGNGDSKKHRLWSEDDEIVILQGMIKYSSKTGAVPAADLSGFHDFIRKKLLHFDFTRAQLIDKIRRLKKKFDNNVGKGRKGEDKTFPKPHEQKAFDLSKKLWGKEARNNKVAPADHSKSNGKSAKKVTQAAKEQFLASLLKAKDTPPPSKMDVEQTSNSTQFNGLDENFIKEGMNRIGSSKKFELGERWRKLHIAEAENFLTRLDLVQEQTKLVLDAFKASEH